ncbi:MAG: DUF1800 domain-containing protein [Verrucomicrobiota bacterium]
MKKLTLRTTCLTLSCALALGLAVSSRAQSDSGPLDAAKAAMEKARKDHAAAQKAVADANAGADKESAERALREKSKALQKAEEAFRAQETFAADKAVEPAKGALAKAEKALAAAEQSPEKKKAAEAEVAKAREALSRALERAAQAKAAVLGGLKPLAASEWDYEKARHLLFRAGFGGPPEEVARLHQMGLFAAVDYLVDYHLQPEPGGWFDAFPHLRTAPYEKHLNASQQAELNQSRVTFRQNQHHRMRRAWLQRMAETQRPLQEKLTLFWHGHFATSFLAGEDSYAMWQQNELFRRRASGNFGALLNGIAHDPAMIRYLDNHENFKGSGNENLGREILELFSMGEGKGYTEKDLAEAARALTGYNFEYHNGQFKFLASRHDNSEKTLFGKTGNFGGDDLVDLILQQPSTSRYITAKLFRFFAHDEPADETIEKMSAMLRGMQYELKPMLRNLFQSEEFYSEKSMGNHIKSPVELMIGAIRTLKLNKVDYNTIDSDTTNLGQRLFEPPNVAGWEGGRAWVDASSLLLRYNLVSKLIASADLVAWFEQSEIADPAAAVDYLARAVLCVPLSEPKRQELVKYLGQLPPSDQWAAKRNEINARLRAIVTALVSLPEYQLANAVPVPPHLLQPDLEFAALTVR